VLLIFGVSGGWFYAAAKLEETVNNYKIRLSGQNKKLTCGNQQVKGYPFRLGIFCDSIDFEDVANGLRFKSGAIRTVAQAYQPGKILMEIDGPAILSNRQNGVLEVNWQSLRSNIRANLDGVYASSVFAKFVTITKSGVLNQKTTADALELHARRQGSNDVDIAFGANSVQLPLFDGRTIAPFEVSVQLAGKDLFNVIQQQKDIVKHLKLQGGEGTITAVRFEPSAGGKLLLSGPISVDKIGRLSGNLTITIDDSSLLFEYFQVIFPEFRKELKQISGTVGMIGGGDQSSQTLKLQIRKNVIQFGLFPLGVLPPLF